MTVGGDLGPVDRLLYDASQESKGKVHRVIIAERFVIVQRRQQFRGSQGGGAGLINEHLQTHREEVITLADRHFIFSVERSGAIGVGEAVPLVVEYGLYPIVSRENTGQRRVPQKGRFEELGEMDILCGRLLETQGGCRHAQDEDLRI